MWSLDALSICCLESRTFNPLADTGRNPLTSGALEERSMMSSWEESASSLKSAFKSGKERGAKRLRRGNGDKFLL